MSGRFEGHVVVLGGGPAGAATAIGGGISGSGPSIFMLSKTRERAEIVRTAVSEIYEPTGIPFNTYVSEIVSQGTSLR